MLNAGTVLINDVIAPTADPRVPFGGRGASGYGVTRGAEGLLEMTAVKVLLIRRGGVMLHLDPTSDEDAAMFAGLIRTMHGKGLATRWTALKQLVKGLRRKSPRLDALLAGLPDVLVDLQAEACGQAVGEHPLDERGAGRGRSCRWSAGRLGVLRKAGERRTVAAADCRGCGCG